MGLGLAEPGFHSACYVETDAHAQATLVAGMLGGFLPGSSEHGAGSEGVSGQRLSAWRPGYLRPAPVWGNLRTFVGYEWRGYIDTILAGYPCQPFSAAGKRGGADDERHLWPDVARIIREVDPEWVFLENVAGHVSLGLETVLRDLWEMGRTPACGLFSAGETGTPHERLRVFIVAHRNRAQRCADGRRPDAGTDGRNDAGRGGGIGARNVVHSECSERRSDIAARNVTHRDDTGRHKAPSRIGESSSTLGHPAGLGCATGQLENPELAGTGCDWLSPDQQGRNALDRRREGLRCGNGAVGANRPASDGGELADAESDQRRGEQPAGSARGGRPGFAGTGPELADASGAGPQGQQSGIYHPGERQDADGSSRSQIRARIFPPGPSDMAGWADALAIAPDLAPAAGLGDCLAWAARVAAALEIEGETAVESRIRRMADGMAARSRALRLLGNGVCPLAAGYAWRTLSAAHGLGPLDLEASGGSACDDADGHVRGKNV